ncbi:MAG: hypothetical protein D3904_09335 [Candidatus Electrothrix sp. EH2]|nr:hypothetical protein [Candidatus Electrothrix sp. EH2]
MSLRIASQAARAVGAKNFCPYIPSLHLPLPATPHVIQPGYHRHSIRLRRYDYAQAGAYFVTICTHHQECLFGEITDRIMRLNDAGMI